MPPLSPTLTPPCLLPFVPFVVFSLLCCFSCLPYPLFPPPTAMLGGWGGGLGRDGERGVSEKIDCSVCVVLCAVCVLARVEVSFGGKKGGGGGACERETLVAVFFPFFFFFLLFFLRSFFCVSASASFSLSRIRVVRRFHGSLSPHSEIGGGKGGGTPATPTPLKHLRATTLVQFWVLWV